ncbi:MAG: hypothetical protein FRX49_07958 [Trebouxia sp. A1-2]|nr:MAG: hypothetical protein FRX49_07958 [Trebouxia sp. A1-2]
MTERVPDSMCIGEDKLRDKICKSSTMPGNELDIDRLGERRRSSCVKEMTTSQTLVTSPAGLVTASAAFGVQW